MANPILNRQTTSNVSSEPAEIILICTSQLEANDIDKIINGDVGVLEIISYDDEIDSWRVHPLSVMGSKPLNYLVYDLRCTSLNTDDLESIATFIKLFAGEKVIALIPVNSKTKAIFNEVFQQSATFALIDDHAAQLRKEITQATLQGTLPASIAEEMLETLHRYIETQSNCLNERIGTLNKQLPFL